MVYKLFDEKTAMLPDKFATIGGAIKSETMLNHQLTK